MHEILNNKEVSFENLAEHKRMLNLVLGNYNLKDSHYTNAKTHVAYLKQAINKWVLKWNKIKNSKELEVSLSK